MEISVKGTGPPGSLWQGPKRYLIIIKSLTNVTSGVTFVTSMESYSCYSSCNIC